jgi:hypothetical protein
MCFRLIVELMNQTEAFRTRFASLTLDYPYECYDMHYCVARELMEEELIFLQNFDNRLVH